MQRKIARMLIRLLAVVLLAQANFVSARENHQELSPRQQEIIRIVRSTEGYVTKDLHDEFWRLMPPEINTPSGYKMFADMFKEVSEAREVFLRESWVSARASLRAGKVVRTPAYIEAQEKALAASENPGYQKSMLESIAGAERLLFAAATGTPVSTPDGKYYVTEDAAEKVLSGIEASEFRFGRLIKPLWDAQPREFRYPAAHVSVLSPEPFVMERESVHSAAGRTANMVYLSRALNKSSFLSISFSTTNGAFIDPNKSLISIANAALAGAGVTGRSPAALAWQGRNSATGVGVARTSEGDVYVAVRVVEIRELNAIVQFLVATDLSAAETINLRGQLEETTNIIP